MIFGYSLLLGFGLVVSAPWWLLRMATTARYREGLRERLGRVPERVQSAVAGKRVVWVHAVSVGEVLAASRLVEELEQALNADAVRDEVWRVVVSTTTRTGQGLARERFGAERVFHLPLDFAWAVGAWMRVLRPALVVLVESELWPRLLHECERRGVPVAVVNARMSDRSFRRAMRVRPVWRRVLGKVSLFLAQSGETAERLLTLGVSNQAVRVTGNLKYDVRSPKESKVAELLRTALEGRQVIVAGSTVEGEDELILAAFNEIWFSGQARSFLIIAPRHPERFAKLVALGDDFGAVRATSLTRENVGKLLRQEAYRDGTGVTLESNTLAVVLDTIGDLAAVYALADVAMVGGSFVSGGGHNPLEPARFGVPVVIGPSFENFRDVVRTMRTADAIRIVGETAEAVSLNQAKKAAEADQPHALRDELVRAVLDLLRSPAAAKAMGERGRNVFQREGGATERSVAALLAVVRASRQDGAEVST